MASALLRCILRANSRSVSVVQHRAKSSLDRFIDPVDLTTGLEKKELLARAAGNDNPFDMRVYKRGPGTRDDPNIVPSFEPKRIVGCICEDDSTSISWMWLYQGESKRCQCGYWFKLTEATPF